LAVRESGFRKSRARGDGLLDEILLVELINAGATDTRLRLGALRVTDLRNGSALDFSVSLDLS
jgi:hypothetical protein